MRDGSDSITNLCRFLMEIVYTQIIQCSSLNFLAILETVENLENRAPSLQQPCHPTLTYCSTSKFVGACSRRAPECSVTHLHALGCPPHYQLLVSRGGVKAVTIGSWGRIIERLPTDLIATSSTQPCVTHHDNLGAFSYLFFSALPIPVIDETCPHYGG